MIIRRRACSNSRRIWRTRVHPGGLRREFLASGVPVTETARRLGYREVSSFSQAFRRWKGMSPRAYRTMTTAGGGPSIRREQ
ncbi:helix-turn-helix domain-containing protein [Mycobacterium sp. NPDC006124]|uniref:helix-turn-helix domain-containing protein n=1 Tax=Mycobacterium sp. NPDC006124 TaxID=3156729 RepID=UPI0033B8626E